MAHLRERHLKEPFEKLAAHAKIVGVIGHRQVGKTTFIESRCKEYVTLDDANSLESASRGAQKFLQGLGGRLSTIDECQKVPELFPALKLAVQRNSRPGQFVLSGSIRFSSRKAIRESLAGRISNLEVYPLVLSELARGRLPDFFPRALKADNFSEFTNRFNLSRAVLNQRRKWIELYLQRGGLPGICFVRDASTRARLMNDLLFTILDRDLRLIYPTDVPYDQLIALCRALARSCGEVPRWTSLSRETKISVKTLHKLLYALGAVFMIRPMPVEGGGASGAVYFFEDQLEESHLSAGALPLSIQRAGLIYRNMRAQFEYRLGAQPYYFHYRTRAGSVIPLAMMLDRKVLGVYPVGSMADVGRAQKSAATSFIRKYPGSKVIFAAFESNEFEAMDDRVLLCPVEAMLFSS